MMKIELTEDELSELKQFQRNVVGTDYIKVTSILMLHSGLSPHTVSESSGIDISTVCRYAALYSAGGIAPPLTANRNKGYWGMLSSHEISLLRSELKCHIYTDAKGITSWIRDSFGVSYTPEGIVNLLNRIGFTYKKTKEVPCEVNAEKQEAFVQELPEIIACMDETSVIYYADGVHPTHNSRPAYAWIEKGREMEQPTVSGRDRVNINGLLNAKDVTDVIAMSAKASMRNQPKCFIRLLWTNIPKPNAYILFPTMRNITETRS
ncbi:MAG: winged helix-turn-helix domain-containing protein [Tannerellaceae bacterium]|jgi:transposase|nr:winged helix-turn-helix domain-containing protein [Tannerellaceae bacterium]